MVTSRKRNAEAMAIMLFLRTVILEIKKPAQNTMFLNEINVKIKSAILSSDQL